VPRGKAAFAGIEQCLYGSLQAANQPEARLGVELTVQSDHATVVVDPVPKPGSVALALRGVDPSFVFSAQRCLLHGASETVGGGATCDANESGFVADEKCLCIVVEMPDGTGNNIEMMRRDSARNDRFTESRKLVERVHALHVAAGFGARDQRCLDDDLFGHDSRRSVGEFPKSRIEHDANRVDLSLQGRDAFESPANAIETESRDGVTIEAENTVDTNVDGGGAHTAMRRRCVARSDCMGR
jgi:hypothetical protein